MDKKQLIEYLDAVCDAESAIQACDDAIALFEGQKRRVPVPTEPYAPVHEVAVKKAVKGSGAWELIGWVLWLPLWALFFIIGGGDSHIANFVGLALGIIVSLLISNMLQKHMDERKSKAVFAQDQQQAALRNQQADQQYRDKMASYQEAKRCYEAAVGALDDHIHRQQEIRSEVRVRLNKLYSLDVIYPRFRNLIAVYQIREYLQMGICEDLEGTNGAYSMYLNDERTERICSSVHELKKSLTSAIRSLQGALVQELRTVDGNLTALGNNLKGGMQGITQQMQEMQRLQQAGTAQMSAHLAEANRHLASMRDNTAIMAHNQYVEQRINNVDAYLLRWPGV